MPTRKISDDERPCMHLDHDPPKHIALSPGIYEHACLGCGRRVTFRVDGMYLERGSRSPVASTVGFGRGHSGRGSAR